MCNLLLMLLMLWGGCRDNRNGIPDAPIPNPPTPSSEIYLTPRQADSNQIEFKKDGDGWIVTTGGFDPFFFVDASKEVNIKTHYILSFESFNTTESLPLIIFVGSALDNNHLIEGYRMPRTEGWITNSYDISVTLESPPTPFTQLRIRFGMSAGKTFKVRNFILREPTEQEKESVENRENLERQDQELTARLQKYLSKNFQSRITSIQANHGDGKILINGQTNRTDFKNIGLAEIPMWEDATNLKKPTTFIPLTSSDISVSIDRIADDKHDRLLSGWAIVEAKADGYELLSAMHYIDDITPRSHLSNIIPRTLKGIGGCPPDHQDLIDLGIASVTFNILLDQVLYTENGAGRIPYTYAGKTWYADVQGEHLKGIDKDMKIAQQKNWMVSAILLIPVNRSGDKKSWLGLAAHPETQPSAAFSMPNFTTKEGAEAYAATMSFLTERYSNETYGRIHHWIIHNEIQNGFYWCNAGKKTKETYMNLYQKSMRTVYLLARQYDENAKVLISLDHDWNRIGDPRGFKGKEVLELLNSFGRKEADFEWGIAYHPYAQDINNPRTWEDTQATYSFDTPYLTFKNLEVLDAWTNQPSVLFKGKPREIQFTEQGLNSPDYGEKSLWDQAAGMVYIWEKVIRMKNVTAFQYHLWADAYEEEGLRLGLRKYYDTQGDPLGKKPIWEVYRAFETSDWDNVKEKYKSTLGISNWDEVYYKGTIY